MDRKLVERRLRNTDAYSREERKRFGRRFNIFLTNALRRLLHPGRRFENIDAILSPTPPRGGRCLFTRTQIP